MHDSSDWQDAAFNTRHMHNRNDRGGQSGNTRHEFRVRNTFGTHLVKCPAIDRLGPDSAPPASRPAKGPKRRDSANSDVVLDIYRLTDDEDGLLGSLRFPGFFEATVVFAGSRKVLWNIARKLGGPDHISPHPDPSANRKAGKKGTSKETDTNGERAGEKEEEGEEEEESDHDEDEEPSSDEAGSDDILSRSSSEGYQRRQRHRVATFEKNSFRQPKFWFRWQGVVARDASTPLEDVDADGGAKAVHGSGYVVFASNDCKRFQGTITSEQLAWNNVKLTGWKTKPQPERDFEIQWGK